MRTFLICFETAGRSRASFLLQADNHGEAYGLVKALFPQAVMVSTSYWPSRHGLGGS